MTKKKNINLICKTNTCLVLLGLEKKKEKKKSGVGIHLRIFQQVIFRTLSEQNCSQIIGIKNRRFSRAVWTAILCPRARNRRNVLFSSRRDVPTYLCGACVHVRSALNSRAIFPTLTPVRRMPRARVFAEIEF